MTLREAVESKGGQHGLVSDAYDDEPEAVCFGYEQEAYAALARLPAIHTYTMIAFFCYFGHVWLLMQRPDLAVTIIAAMMAYGLVRFWLIWFSAFHGLYLLYKCDSRDPTYWQRQPRPLGSPEFNSVVFPFLARALFLPSTSVPSFCPFALNLPLCESLCATADI